MEKTVLLIVNPHSGDGVAKRWVYDMTSALLGVYDYVTVYFSKCTGDAARVARQKAGMYDAVVCCGGDGTLNETVRGICESGADPMLGYIPTGTINDFATSHGIPKGIRDALSKLCSGTPSRYDAGMLGDRCFAYVAAFGAFTDVTYLTPQLSKAAIGRVAYFAEGAKRLLSLAPIHLSVSCNEMQIEGDFILGMVSNSKTVGGFRFFDKNTSQDLSDGLLEVLLVRYPKSNAMLQDAIIGLINSKAQSDMVIRLKTSSISFRFSQETPWTVDGEFGGNHTEVSARCLHQRLNLIE